MNKKEQKKKATAIDWNQIISLMVVARATSPKAAMMFRPFTTAYLNDLVETAVGFATEAANKEAELQSLKRRAEAPPDSFGQPEPNCPCTVIPKTLEESRIETAINRFARDMEARMRANLHKGDWSDCSRGYLITRLGRAVDDLKTSHGGRPYPETIIRRAADVANYAMMIADQEANKARAEKERPDIYSPNKPESEGSE